VVILQWLGAGMTNDEIIADFPALAREDMLAALQFAANREDITKIVAA
jgi:uncharacterized protein (DUF433 family)